MLLYFLFSGSVVLNLWYIPESLRGVLKTQKSDPHPTPITNVRVSDSVGLGWGSIIGISNKFPVDADHSGPGIIL